VPYCGQWARATLPVLVNRFVRRGKLRVVFNGMAFVGTDSDTALRTALAAGRHGHLWDVVHGLYERQGAENSGWVSDELVGEIAAGVPGLVGGKLLEEGWDDRVGRELDRSAERAQSAGITGTPSFELGPTGGSLQRVAIRSLEPEGIVPQIEEALAR
jgi:protein-disulfide isomerase